MDDTERLIVQLEARIDAFEKNMAKASRSADHNFRTIETRAKRAADSMQATMGKAAEGVAGLFTGIGRNVLGAVGIGGLGLSAAFATAVKLNGELAKIPGLAREAALSTDRIQEIKFAANIKGVTDEEFTAGLRTSLGLLDEAQRNVNSLLRLFNANGLSIRDGNGQLIKFDQLLENAARLMAGTRSEQEKIKIAEMLGLSRDWIAVLRDGPEAFRRAAAEAHNAGAVIDKETVQRAKDFDRAWKEAIIRFKSGLTETLSDLSQAFGEFWDDVLNSVPGGNFIGRFMDRLAGGLRGMSLPDLEDVLQRSIEQGVDKIEINRIQAEIDRRTGKQPLRITVTPEVGDVPATIVPKEKQKNPFDSALFEAQRRIAGLDAETTSLGLNTEARERAKIVAQLEEAAKRANTEAGFQNAVVTDAQREKINRLADAMESAVKRQREAHEALLRFAVDGQDFVKQFDSLAISAFGNVENAFAGFITGAKDAKAAFADMATAILNDLTKMIIRMTITAPLAQALGGMLGGGAGLGGGGIVGTVIGGLLHSGHGPGDPITTGRAVSPAVFANAPRFHSGIGPGEMASVIRKDESVLTPGQMRMLAPASQSQAPGPISVIINGVIPADTKATATTKREGSGTRVDVWLKRNVEDTTAAAIDSGESPVNSSLERRYGLRPRLA